MYSAAMQIAAEGARKRAALETYVRHEATLRRTARRYSLCEDDADDALQRALEILLTKAPSEDPRELIRWTQTVVKHEALAVRRERERILSGPAAVTPEPGREDWVALLPSEADGPPERAERREKLARSREALRTLKPQELRALSLLAEGYSYVEIGEITGFSQTKINRCLAEGRERFRKFLAGSEDGSRCKEMGALLSAFSDGEASPDDAATVREHLRACVSCKARLRAYRAAPHAAAALAPALPLSRSLLDRLHDAITDLSTRLGNRGGSGEAAMSQVAAGGAGSAGLAGMAKTAVLCVSAVGGAAACVATGVVPMPIESAPEQAPALERRLNPAADELPAAESEMPREPTAPAGQQARTPWSARPDTAAAVAAPEPEPEITSGAPTESEPEPEVAPVPEPSGEPPAASAPSGSPAGEFGP